MEFALGAATVAISRAGASSLAEIAAMRVPSILIPYPHAADDHQFYNALEFVTSGAGRTLEQSKATPDILVSKIVELAKNETVRAEIQNALAKWHTPDAAEKIANHMLAALSFHDRVISGGASSVRNDEPPMFHPRLTSIGKESKCST
jgi:UDP-N-acetylglucosamine--N-acetylmuramyl-(pentapeptide) pyrophosphoryl-undecaprenol N-acetylglucosamine transferase